jgi:arylsulfatase A-like enzyme
MKAPLINILWLVSEDCSPRGSSYGDHLVETPNIDRLAEQGVLFENAFSTYPVCAPSRFSLITGMEPASCGPAHHMRSVAKFPTEFKTYTEYFRAAGYYCSNNSKTDYNSDINPSEIWNDSSNHAHWRARKDEQPFLAVFNADVTHESAIFYDTDSDLKLDQVRMPDYLPDTIEIRMDLVRHYSAVKKMDAYFGEILRQLEEDGLSESTVVIYSSDHGGVAPRSKRFCYDEGLKVPLIFSIPAKLPGMSKWQLGSRVKTPVSLIDVAPTLLSIAGIEIPNNMHGDAIFGPSTTISRGVAFGGRDRMDERYDFVRTVRNDRFRYIRNYYPDRAHGQHIGFMFLAQGYQSWEREFINGNLNELQSAFWLEKSAEELYDIVDDPDQLVNLATSDGHSKILATLRATLDEHLIRINDNGFIPEGSGAEGYFASRVEETYPIKNVIELANLAILSDTVNSDLFLNTLNSSSNEIMRYWAAIGIRLLSSKNDKALLALSNQLKSESSPFVRIVIAECLARWAKSNLAVVELASYLSDGNSRNHKLMALNSLVYVDNQLLLDHMESFRNLSKDDDPILSAAAAYLFLLASGEYTPDSKTFDLQSFLDSYSERDSK